MSTLLRAGLAALLLFVTLPVMAQDELPKEQPPPAKHAGPSDIAPSRPQEPPAAEEPGVPPPGSMFDQPVAVLQALDKITARIRRLEIEVGQSAPFGTLSVKVDACRKAPPEDPPESAAFLEITDTRPGEAPQIVFMGWMFASSPALSALDHPVYDIWVLDCSADATASAVKSAPSH